MAYSVVIARGIRFISSILNADGGVPATKPGDPSGCWTSAESLEVMLTAGVHELDPRPMAESLLSFLLANQIVGGQDAGGWPLVAGGRQASAMATGHAVSALHAVLRFFPSDQQIHQRVNVSIAAGFQWLEGHRNAERGWGVEPSSGGDGAQLRMISTVYALRGYSSAGKTVQNSGTVKQACQAILSLQNSDGGFGGKRGAPSDACNTARALIGILDCNGLAPRDRAIKRGVSYILSQKPRNKQWPLATESYVTQSAPGQTVFNSNTPADAIEALLRVERYDRLVETSLEWLVSLQNDDGSWMLASTDRTIPEVITWPTNEAMSTLSLASRVFVSKRLPSVRAEVRRYRWTVGLLSLFCILEGVILIFSPQLLQTLWNLVPDSVRSLIVGGLILALLVNLLSSFVWEKIRNR